MGFRDNSGNIINNNDDHSFMFSVMHFMNSLAKKTSTYKYAFFKSILDNLFNVNDQLEINFETLSYSFSKIYWNLISKYKLPQYQNGKAMSLMEKEVYYMITKYPEVEEREFDSIKEDYQKEYLYKTKDVIKINVVGALWSDLNESIYGFNKQEKKIWFSNESYQFLLNYKSSLEKLNYYAWILWMENNLSIKGQEVGNLASKLDLSTHRESLKKFKEELEEKGDELRCFYCGKKLQIANCHLDHFVPWSFVKDDKLWNLVFSCSFCNISKSDRLPREEYINKIIIRNKKVFDKTYQIEINKLYNSAKYNGYVYWDKHR